MSASPRQAYIGLGGNLGPAGETLRAAWAVLSARPGVQARALSPLYRSAPVDAGGPDYVNAVGCLDWSGEPLALLDLLQAVEADFGRERPYHHAPRTLDLDLLLLGDLHLSHPRLSLPHPRLHLRAFVLRPLADLAPSLVLDQGPLAPLLAAVADQRIEPLRGQD